MCLAVQCLWFPKAVRRQLTRLCTYTGQANNGVKFGNTKYAPTAAEMAKWCVSKKKMVKGGLSQNNVDKMKINAGDIMFESGADNGRYKGVYHVEMVVGYVCLGLIITESRSWH